MLQCELIHFEGGLNLEAPYGSVLCIFPPDCKCVCAQIRCKSIFVCFATSPDIPFGATDRKAVKCDLNILCLHLLPPPRSLFLVLSHFPLISFFFPFSIDNNIIGSRDVSMRLMACPPPHHPTHLPWRSKIICCYLYHCLLTP